MSETTEAQPEVLPEVQSEEALAEVPDDIAPASDAAPNATPADDAALDDAEVIDNDSSGLYSEDAGEPDTENVTQAIVEDHPGDEEDAAGEADAGNAVENDASGADGAQKTDADDDTNEVGNAGDAAESAEADVAPSASVEEAQEAQEAPPDSASAHPVTEEATDVILPDVGQDAAIATADEQPTLGPPDNATSPSSIVAGGSSSAPEEPAEEPGDFEEGEIEDAQDVRAPNDVDIDADANVDPDESNATGQTSEDPSEELPYIADIAMVDTGEPGEIQPGAPVASSFSASLVEPQSTSPTIVDDGESQRQSAADNEGPGIDFDKMIDAISGETPEPPATTKVAASPPTGAPKGPSNPFPRPPTGPARMTGRFPNSSLPSGPAPGAPGATGGMATPGSPSALPAAAGRRGQASRGAQGQPAAAPRQANNAREKASVDRAYQAFLNEEKIHVAEGNWEAFPEGSRMFVGNLSQERVSKRDVFEQFHKYGRLAQISIKSAYGFVQYHSADEALAAMRYLEGAEIRGRKIHLEVSRPPKKEKDHVRDGEQGRDRDRDRGRGGSNRSPERTKSRGGRDGDRYDGRAQDDRRHARDEHWSSSHGGHGSSPLRGQGRSDSIGQEPDSRDKYSRRSRERSRSPNRTGGRGDDSRGYRSRRSPSPHGRSRHGGGRGGHDALKTRHSGDVPDVQFLVSQGLDREFIKWVQGPFFERGLKTDVLYLSSHTPPRDSIIQVHVLEGVIAVVDLDSRAQATGTIPVQVFNRSAGVKNVRFDGYQDLTPPVAADVVARAKSAAVVHQHQPAYSQAYPAAATYGQPYVPPYQMAAPAPAAAPNNVADLAALFGQLDNTTLAQVLGALQTQQAPAVAPPTTYAQVPQAAPYSAAADTTQHAQLAALLSTLGATAPAPAAAPAAPSVYGAPAAPYASSMPGAAPAAALFSSIPAGTDEQTVQAILAQFAQSRQ